MAGAQQTQTGSVSGTVTGAGKPLPGVTVQASSDVLPKPRSTVTGSLGEYRLPALPPGTYRVLFNLRGFATESRSFPVHLQRDSVIDVEMKAARFEDEINITAATPTIDTTSAELKASVPDTVIENVPVGQQYRDLVKLIPGVMYTEDTVRGPSAGGSGQDNSYEFDGVSVSLPLFGTLSTEPATQDVEEMVVVKGGANAVGFNRSGGMLVNTLSKSGTIEYHGGVAPVSLVEEVLDLHAAYLSLQRPPALSSSSGPPPLPPAAHVPPPGYPPPGYAPPPAPPRSR